MDSHSHRGICPGAALPSGIRPTFVFDTHCNGKFKLEISPLAGFTDPRKIRGFNYTVNDPNTQPSLSKTLTPLQWSIVKKLVRIGTGYFRIRAWDGINRETASEVRSFIIQ
jgi:hypothetical protein